MKYILTSEKLNGKILFDFTSKGLLKAFEIEAEDDVGEKLVRWFLGYMPLHEKAMRAHPYITVFKVEKVGTDLTFKAFWEAYAYKVGNKKRAEKLWGALTEPERAQAMAAAVKYKRWLSTRNQDQAYAETWLKQRRFENNYN